MCGNEIKDKSQRKFCSIECSNIFFNKRDRKEYRVKYWLDNKKRLNLNRKQNWKRYAEKNREKLKNKAKEYYLKNQDKIKEYRNKNRDKLRIKFKEFRKKNKTRLYEKNQLMRKQYLSSWENFIPIQTSCQVCGNKIYFNNKNKKNAIHFDHKNDKDVPIKKSPSTWLGGHPRTLNNELIWRKCNFGMLCKKCNSFLPTKNRKKFIKNIIKYIGGV